MDLFQGYKLEQTENGYTLILFLYPQSSEFADELTQGIEIKLSILNENIQIYIKQQFPKLKINMVKLMLGSILIASIPLPETQADGSSFHMSYMYFGNPESSLYYVDRTKGVLQEVCPSYFDLNADGTLKLSSKLNSQFIEEMHNRDIKTVPFLSNHWDRELGRAALRNREVLSQQIADAVIQQDLDGVNVDIEHITEADRESFSDFVRLLREKIPSNKEVSVAVAPNPYGWTTGWQGAYDYSALAQHADYLMVMAYDESYEGGKPGPVASIGFVEKSIQYAFKKAPAQKIVLGIPFYGRYWKQGAARGGYGISSSKVEALVKKYNGKITFDEKSKSPKAVVQITAQEGKHLSPGTYTIWFENQKSIYYKLQLVNQYGLKGTGSWSLGQETLGLWDNYLKLLQEGMFFDILGHWAEKDILAVGEKGWMKGVSESDFAPDAPLSRAQAAVILVRALRLQEKYMSSSFKDVPSTHWAKKEIEIAAQHGLLKGKEKGLFSPEEKITREEMAVLLYRALGSKLSPQYKQASFADLSSKRWSYSAIIAHCKSGIFKGYADGKFHPEEKISRAQMAAILNRLPISDK